MFRPLLRFIKLFYFPFLIGTFFLTPSAFAENSTTRSCPEKPIVNFFPQDYFQGVKLEKALPNTFWENEIYNLNGLISDPKASSVRAFFQDGDGTQNVFSNEKNNKNFSIPIIFSTLGNLNFSILNENQKSNFAAILNVLPLAECWVKNLTNTVSRQSPNGLTLKFNDNNVTANWQTQDDFSRVTFQQGKKEKTFLVSNGQNKITLRPQDFTDFTTGKATWWVESAKMNTDRMPTQAWTKSTPKKILLSQHHSAQWNKEQLSLKKFNFFYRGKKITLAGKNLVDLQKDASIILPDGRVEKIPLTSNKQIEKNNNGIEVLPPKTNFSFSFPIEQEDVYIIELNDANGLAVFNAPIYPKKINLIPILPDFFDSREGKLSSPSSTNFDLQKAQQELLDLTNAAREKAGLTKILLDKDLNNLAQNYVIDMTEHNFFGHFDLLGQSPDDRRKKMGLKRPVGENLARTENIISAQEGWMRSAIHRALILNPSWTKVGFGILPKGNDVYFSAEFSTNELNWENLQNLKNELKMNLDKNRAKPLSSEEKLNAIAQDWSQAMIKENFFGIENNGKNLTQLAREAGINTSLNMFILENYDENSLLNSTIESVSEIAKKRQKIGIGVATDEYGKIKLTLILSD